MSNKGNKVSIETRAKISIAKTKHTENQLVRSAKGYIRHLEENERELPTLAGFCLFARISKSKVREYGVKYPKVGAYLEALDLAQEQYCLTRGIPISYFSPYSSLLNLTHPLRPYSSPITPLNLSGNSLINIDKYSMLNSSSSFFTTSS